MVMIRLYTANDHSALLQLMLQLQSYLAPLDSLHRVRDTSDFDAAAYIEHLLSMVQHDRGSLFVADEHGTVIGFMAGSIHTADSVDLLDHYPAKEGTIHELVVSETHREKGIGRQLMEKLEEQFRSQECEYIRVGCFAPNSKAYAFYEKCGYDDRYIEMLKRL